jgi:hypothetical protein
MDYQEKRKLIAKLIAAVNEIANEGRQGQANYVLIPEENIKELAMRFFVTEEQIREILKEYFLPLYSKS